LADKAADWTKGQRRFEFRPGEVKAWPTLTNAEAMVMTRWVESRLPIASIDESAHLLNLTKRSVFELSPGDLYYLEGAPDFLDAPGEWCLDSAGLLRYLPLPDETVASSVAIAPLLAQVLRFEGRPESSNYVQGVSVEGITFSHTEWCFPEGFANGVNKPVIDPAPDPEVGGFGQAAIGVPSAVWGQGMRDCVFRNCNFSNLGTYGLELSRGCSSNRVLHCNFSALGGGGIKIGETAIRSEAHLIASRNEIADCHIYDGGKMFHSAIGIWIGQSPGNWIHHNQINDFYYTGISIGWTWGYGQALASNNIVEFNHVHHIGVMSDGDGPILSDMAGIYTLGKQPGTVIRNNLWHDTAGIRYGGWGIYFDEGSSGILAENNIVYRTTHGGFHQHYGETNIVRNNIFAFARDYQLQRSRSEPHVSFSFQTNIVYFDSGVLFGSEWSGDKYQLDWNVYYDARTAGGAQTPNIGPCSWKEWQERGHDSHSVLADPGFESVTNGNFRLKKDSPALKFGFRSIDITRIGVRQE
jgi:parallel beta-helix repeat protein